MIETHARNATFVDLRRLLEQQQDAKIDAVVPATAMRSKGGIIHITGTAPQLTEDGVTMTTGSFRPTTVFDEGVAAKLGVPLKYLRGLRDNRPDLYDANVNGWLHGARARTVATGNPAEPLALVHDAYPADPRSFLFRGFADLDTQGGEGVARSLSSDSYGIVDHLDVLTAVLSGVREAGVKVELGRCDLTDRSMYVQINAPEMAVMAPVLLAGYRSPFSGALGTDNPLVSAGLVVKNSETGNGATQVTPRVVVQVCNNGMVMSVDAVRAVHVGGRLPEGIVKWSEDTERKNLAVVTAKARDAVATFLSAEYVAKVVAELEAQSSTPVTNAANTVELVGTKLKFTDEQRAGVLDHFISGGQLTAGGIMHAVTSYCQTVDNADTAYDMEALAPQAMALAARSQ